MSRCATKKMYESEELFWPSIPPAVKLLADEVRAAHCKPIRYIVFSDERAYKGGAAEDHDALLIWLSEHHLEPYYVGHELAHLLSYTQREVPRIHPTEPPPPLRPAVADFISLLDHQFVPLILEERGISTTEERSRQSQSFLNLMRSSFAFGAGPLADLWENKVWFIILYAMMRTCYYDESLAAEIEGEVSKRASMARSSTNLLVDAIRNFMRSPSDMYVEFSKYMEVLSVHETWARYMLRPSQVHKLANKVIAPDVT